MNWKFGYSLSTDEVERQLFGLASLAVDGLKAVHVYLSKYSPRPLGHLTEESRKNLPQPGIHPLVRRHPENHRKALFLNPVRMESILGMEDADALALMR